MQTKLTLVFVAVAACAAPAAFAADDARSGALESAIASMLAGEVPVYATAKAVRPAPGEQPWFERQPRQADPFDGFARPITNIDFHHPFIWNELRPLFMRHRFPKTSATGGGNLRVYAVQINAKLTDDVLFTAYKGGYTDFNPRALPDGEGWNDIAFGLKYKVWEDLQAPAIATVGLGYETKAGAKDVLQGMGSGLFDAFGSYARSLGPLNVITTLGVKIPNDSGDDARQLHWHLHGDYPMSDTVRLVGEVNGYHYLDDARRNLGLGPTVPLDFEGFDYTSLGSGNVEGNDVVTAAAGFRWFATDDVSIGAAWEWSVTQREDLFQDRLTLDMVFRF